MNKEKADSVCERLAAILRSGTVERASLERRKGGWRLRYYQNIPGGRGTVRKALALPNSDDLVVAIQRRLENIRIVRQWAAGEPAMASAYDAGECAALIAELEILRENVVAACARGRVVRARVGRMFDLAASQGDAALEDFIAHQPWLARPKKAGRRPRYGSDDNGVLQKIAKRELTSYGY